MQIREIDNKNKWENFIAKYSPQSLFQSWNWGETIRKSNDKKVSFKNYFGLFDSANNLKGIFQIVKVEATRGTYLHLRHGPILSLWNLNNLRFIKNYLIKLAETENAAFIRLSPLIELSKYHISLFKKSGFINSPIHSMDGEYCWVLDLDKSDDELLKEMRKTTRYLIRWALKNKVEIKISQDSFAIGEFLKLYDLTSKRQHFIKHQGIKEEFEIFAKENQALLFLGFHQNKLLSSAIVLFYQNQAIYHHSASIKEKIPVNYLLQWQAILEAKMRKLKIYNFWGIAPSDKGRHPWKNLTLFKKGFGGRTVEYLHSQDLPVKKIPYIKTYCIEYFRKLWKGY